MIRSATWNYSRNRHTTTTTEFTNFKFRTRSERVTTPLSSIIHLARIPLLDIRGVVVLVFFPTRGPWKKSFLEEENMIFKRGRIVEKKYSVRYRCRVKALNNKMYWVYSMHDALDNVYTRDVTVFFFCKLQIPPRCGGLWKKICMMPAYCFSRYDNPLILTLKKP